MQINQKKKGLYHNVILVSKQAEDRGPYVRPWQSPVPPIQVSVDQVVKYPSDTEDTGLVLAAWRGPSAVAQINEWVLEILRFLPLMSW